MSATTWRPDEAVRTQAIHVSETVREGGETHGTAGAITGVTVWFETPIERLNRTREGIMRGRQLTQDSVDVVRQMREERSDQWRPSSQ